MASRDKKKTIQIKAQVAKTDSLRFLWSKLPSFYQDRLELNYGKIVHLLCVPVQIEAITCLAQFYDPPFRCFTFQNFQLAPTIEEFSQVVRSSKKTIGPYKGIGKIVKISDLAALLGIPDLHTYYKDDTEIHGFNRSPLEKIAHGMVDSKKWDNLVDLLALLIFGLILFPNLENFIDDAAISVFWATRVLDEDYVPALLGDVYYTLEMKYIKRKGMMLCCIPLLYRWLMAQIYLKSAIIPVMDRAEWAQKLVSLNEQSVCWYAFKMGKDEVITSCGSFPNVPLIGSRGCISYNPVLALRQIGFPLFEKPEEEALQGIVLHNPAKEFALLSQIIKAWEKVHVKGPELRVRVGQRKESYKQWIRERVELVKLPFVLGESSQAPPPEPAPPTISFEEANDLKARILQLEQEKEEVEVRLNKTTAEKNQLKWDLQQRETQFNALKEKYGQKKDKVKKVKTCLNQADSGLGSLHEQLEEAQIEAGRWGKLWDQAMKEKSELRKGLEGRIRELTQLLKESQARGDKEARLKEEALQRQHPNSSKIRKMQEELDSLWGLKEEHEKLVSDSIYWSGEIAVLKDAFEEARASAIDMEQQAESWKNRFNQMMEYIHDVMGEFPNKVQEAFQEMSLENTHTVVFKFVLFCKSMGQRIHDELQELRKKRPRRGPC